MSQNIIIESTFTIGEIKTAIDTLSRISVAETVPMRTMLYAANDLRVLSGKMLDFCSQVITEMYEDLRDLQDDPDVTLPDPEPCR